MNRSSQLFKTAQQYIPGGVNSPVRAFKGVGGEPIFMQRAKGAYLYDFDNNTYIDYVGSWGPMILGHTHPAVVTAVKQAVDSGLSFGAPTEIETELAKLVCQLMPSIEMVRMVSSGTEATMSAIRLARAHTGREKILKFEGCYHGHGDSFLIKAGSGALTLGVPTSPGVPKSLAEDTLTVPYNDLQAVQEVFNDHGSNIAAIIVEPVAGNMNCILPKPGFLQGLREVSNQYDCLLIFDEVMTGFRVALGGAQSLYQIKPDLTTLGKVIGGGMPVAAFGGKKIIMNELAPVGPVYQAGTLSGNPVAMAAGLTTLKLISKNGFYEKLSAITKTLIDGIKQSADKHQVPLTYNYAGGMFGLFFTEQESVESFGQVNRCDIELFKRFFHGILEQKIYFAPSAFEAGFVSAAHSFDDIEKTVAAADKVFAGLR